VHHDFRGGVDDRAAQRVCVSASQIAARTPAAQIISARCSDRVVPVTSCPAATSRGTSERPMAPLAPATNTFIAPASRPR
jgi:hypothetical protein